MSGLNAERRPVPATPRERLRVLLRSLPLLAGVVGAGAWLGDRFHLGIDDQQDRCLPGNHRWFLIDRHDRNLWRGDLVAFRADGRLSPWIPVGQVVVKQVAGVAGDRVTVTAARVTVNGQPVTAGLALSDRLGQPPADFVRTETLPPGRFWVIGTQPKSFDSRYWGPVEDAQIIGRAYALPF
jgi:conjugal transfer pilin signal peptidase TrbI